MRCLFRIYFFRTKAIDNVGSMASGGKLLTVRARVNARHRGCVCLTACRTAGHYAGAGDAVPVGRRRRGCGRRRRHGPCTFPQWRPELAAHLNPRAWCGFVCVRLQFHLAAGVHGFYVCGSTGEGIYSTVEERKVHRDTAVPSSHAGCRLTIAPSSRPWWKP
jgi:hypothetical protein